MAEIVKVWVGNLGTHQIPQHLLSAKLTKSGWPDKRGKMYQAFMEWAKDK